MTIWPMVISGVLGVVLGIAMVFAWRGKAGNAFWEADTILSDHAAAGQASAAAASLWDPHSCLNALNRAISHLSSQAHASEESILAAAQHIKWLAVLIRSNGLATGEQVRNWLSAWFALHELLHPARRPADLRFDFPDSDIQIDVRPLGQAILSYLANSGPVERVVIQGESLVPAQDLSKDAPDYFQFNVTMSLPQPLPGEAGQERGAVMAFTIKCKAHRSDGY